MGMLRSLGLAALRHYRDPLSWAGIITALGAAAHTAIPAEYMAPIESLLGSAVAILLLMADGRKNPNTTLSGDISERQVPPAGTSPVYTPTPANGHGAAIVPPENIPDAVVVPASRSVDLPTQAGRRPGFNP